MRRLVGLLLLLASCESPEPKVGLDEAGRHVVPTRQIVRPAGRLVEFGGRPVDGALAPDGRFLYVKDNRGIVVIEIDEWKVVQELKFREGGGSMHGIAVNREGTRVYATTAQDMLWEAEVAEGKLAWKRKISLPGPGGKGNSHGCGIALSPDGTRAWVCLSRNNTLAVVDLTSGEIRAQVAVGVAPFDVSLSPDGKTAYVSDWGGRHPGKDERKARSSGTDVVIDQRGVAASGTVSIVDLEKETEIAQVETGLHPSDLEMSRDGSRLYVANANSDSVSVIDTQSRRVVETILVRPDASLPFGSAPNGLALAPDGKTLFVATGGNNAVAVVSLKDGKSEVAGFIPAGWYPGAVLSDGRRLFIINIKGVGTQRRVKDHEGWNVHDHVGCVTKVEIPSAGTLQTYSEQVREDGRVPQILRAREKAESGRQPQPIPWRPGEPSVFEHVVYIIKENRTYDQIFGDLPQGNGDPKLCVFDRDIASNHHALAEEFALLDNYYCNGVLSADGHSWATEGNVTDHLEKSFGGFTRSYTFGDDPLTYSSSGFIWDGVLLHGLSFRNYGEMNDTAIANKGATFKDVYEDFENKTGEIKFLHSIGIETLRRYSCPDYPGWNLSIPDVLRADRFLKEFRGYEARQEWPNFVMIYLPNDHTSGKHPGAPTPRAQVSDNDLALGQIIEAITRSVFWPKTAIFVIEDDPQNGFDHVDGHRSICLVISPFTRRHSVISRFYNQTSVLHTMELILGLPPMNQMDAMAPVMRECFTSTPDLTPYSCRANRIKLDELNARLDQLQGTDLYWARKSLEQRFDRADCANEETLNRILWYSMRGAETPYPEQFAGAHGKGLKRLNLILEENDDDDD